MSIEDLRGAGQGPDLEVATLRLHLRDRWLADPEKPGELGLRESALFAQSDEVLLDAHFGEPLLDASGQIRIFRERVGEPGAEGVRA